MYLVGCCYRRHLGFFQKGSEISIMIMIIIMIIIMIMVIITIIIIVSSSSSSSRSSPPCCPFSRNQNPKRECKLISRRIPCFLGSAVGFDLRWTMGVNRRASWSSHCCLNGLYVSAQIGTRCVLWRPVIMWTHKPLHYRKQKAPIPDTYVSAAVFGGP